MGGCGWWHEGDGVERVLSLLGHVGVDVVGRVGGKGVVGGTERCRGAGVLRGGSLERGRVRVHRC